MRKFYYLFVIAASSLFLFSCSKENEKDFIDHLVSEMTIEEKIGQLVEVVGEVENLESRIKAGEISSILGIKDAAKANHYQKIAIEKSRLGIPLLYTNDVIHGYNTTFPIPLAEASSWNLELIKKVSSLAAIEAASEGTHLTFAPMIDIARDPRWGRIAEGSGEDPYLGGLIAEARVKGFQGENLKDKNTIGACAKHFAAYGAAEAGRDYNSVDISERTLREIYLPPFKKAADAGVVSMMSAFNDLNGVPASANKFILTDILRGEWNWDGFVVSDYNSIGELVNHRFAENKKEAACKALISGVDMDMVGDTISGNTYAPYFKQLLSENKISEKDINVAVKRVLIAKQKLGLFDNPYVDIKYYELNIPGLEEKQKLALQMARESIVLLKNKNSILPLSKNIKSIVVIGELADNPHHPLGPWNCKPVLENVVTPLSGIKNKLGNNVKINYVPAVSPEYEIKNGFEEALKACAVSDAVIFVLGETREMSGEAASRTDISIPGSQLALAKKIAATGKPIIAVLMNGRPLAIEWLDENVDAIVETWFLGDQTGNAVADVLFGDFNPSGKLPVSFPRNAGQIPIYYNSKSTGRPYKENDKFTSKYIDAENSSLYPFGFGQSYSEFEYSDVKLDKEKYIPADTIFISVTIKNNSAIDGTEIIQVYAKDDYASVTRPVKELKAFKKIFIKAGEVQTSKIPLPVNRLAFLDLKLNENIEAGTYKIMVGGNSVDLLSSKLEIIN